MINPETEKRWMEILFQMQGENGLLYFPATNRPWIKKGDIFEGDQPFDNCTILGFSGRYLGAIGLYYKLTGDSRFKELGRRLVDGFNDYAVHKEDYAYFIKNSYPYGEEPSVGPMHPSHGYVAPVITGLIRFYRMSGYQPALDLAGELMRGLMQPECSFNTPDGSFVDTWAGVTNKQHFHRPCHRAEYRQLWRLGGHERLVRCS